MTGIVPQNISTKNGAGYNYWHFSYFDYLTRYETGYGQNRETFTLLPTRNTRLHIFGGLFAFYKTFVGNKKPGVLLAVVLVLRIGMLDAHPSAELDPDTANNTEDIEHYSETAQ